MRLGIGCVVVDTVTRLRANLHAELMAELGADGPDSEPLYATSYRPARVDGRTLLEVSGETLRVGGPLPELPLFLKHGPGVGFDLAGTYAGTAADLRLTAAG